MTGGLIDLKTNGTQDIYLTGNPQITFFKNVFKKHTNFSMEMIKLDPITSTNLNETTTSKLEFKIDRNADLIKEVYFVFTLPDIYSNDTTKDYKFQWIQRIGEYIIDEVNLTIEGQEIQKMYSEYLHIWNELTIDESKKDGYNRMIGNISDLYNPLKSDGTTYPFDNSKIRQSIKSRKIYVPLPFWFTNNSNLALPLIALQYSEVKIILTLKPFNKLYTIIDSGLRKKSPSSTYNLGVFSQSGSIISNLNINPSLEINYIYLDESERKLFADCEHNYLIQQVQSRRSEKITPSLNLETPTSIKLDYQHPITQLIWVIQRSDFENRNQFHNYTNWPDKNIDPVINPTDYDAFENEATFDATNIESYKHKDLLQSAVLKFNGQDRFLVKDFKLFNLINNYQHMTRIPEDGIYVYSFALNMNIKENQPYGSCNFSGIQKCRIKFNNYKS